MNPGIICISSIDWGFSRQRHQILMGALAEKGIPVLFIENMGGREPDRNDLHRIRERIRSIICQILRGDRHEGGVTIHTPFVLPFKSLAWLNNLFFLPMIAKHVSKLGFHQPFIWVYPPTPVAVNLIQLLKPRGIIYDCVASIKDYANVTSDLLASEKFLVQKSNHIFVDSLNQLEEKKPLNPNTERLLPGVDFELFSRDDSRREPSILQNIPHPRLCYFGTIGKWVDLRLLKRFSLHNPDWSVVLIGPTRVPLDWIKSSPHVFYLGPQPHALLPSFLQFMDVLVIPYKTDSFGKSVFPAKLFESLATGLPVIATELPELQIYSKFVTLTTREDFDRQVVLSLQDSDQHRQEREELARNNTWQLRIQRAIEVLHRLGFETAE